MVLFWRLLGSARHAGENQTRLQKSILARLTDGLRGIKPLKAMAREDRLGPLLVSETQGLNRVLRQQVFHRQVLDTQQEPVIVVLLALGLYMRYVWLAVAYDHRACDGAAVLSGYLPNRHSTEAVPGDGDQRKRLLVPAGSHRERGSGTGTKDRRKERQPRKTASVSKA